MTSRKHAGKPIRQAESFQVARNVISIANHLVWDKEASRGNLLTPKPTNSVSTLSIITEHNKKEIQRLQQRKRHNDKSHEEKAARAASMKEYKRSLPEEEKLRQQAKENKRRRGNKRIRRIGLVLARAHHFPGEQYPLYKKGIVCNNICDIFNVPQSVKDMYKGVPEYYLKGTTGHGEAIDGQAQPSVIHQVGLEFIAETEFDGSSIVFDGGAGTGDAVLRLAKLVNCSFFGVEFDRVRYDTSVSILKLMNDPPRGSFIYADLFQLRTFSPCTHVYLFDQCFPVKLTTFLGCVWNNSLTTRAITSNFPPEVLAAHGWENLELLKMIPLTMKGAKDHYSVYIYKRVNAKHGFRVPDDLFEPHCT